MLLRFWKILSLWIMILITVAVSKTWEQVNGPFGGLASCITQCKGSLFAGSSSGGVFRSDDNGESWYHLDSSYNMNLTALVAKGDTLFAGTRYTGLFMSPDLGKTWTNVYPGDNPERREINTLKVIDNTLYAGSYLNVLRSADNGKTWVKINEQPGFPVFYFCRGFTTAGKYYFACSSQGNGVVRSADKGTIWEKVNNGLFDSSVYSLVTIDSVIFAGTYRNNVFKSTDYGATWEQCSNGLPKDSSSCYFLYTDGTRLYASIGKAGFCVSNDYGKSWKVISSPFPFNPAINGMVQIDKNVFIGTGTHVGIYKISLDSMSVLPCNKGFSGHIILSLSSGKSTLLATSYYYNASISQNNGKSWSSFFDVQTNAYASLVKENDLYIGTNGNGVFHKNIATTGEIEKQTVDIDVSKYLDVRGFESIGRYTLACGGNEVLLRKADGESKWIASNSGITPKDYFSNLRENRGRLFLCGFDFYSSDDSGSTWNIKIPRVNGRFNTAVADGKMVYTSSDRSGVYWSIDNGETWNEPVSGLPYVKALAVWNGVVFAGTEGGGIFYSLDTAKTWIALNDGLINYSITSMTIQNKTLFAGTSGNGIFIMDLEKFSEITAVGKFTKSKSVKTNITIIPFGNYYTVSSQKRIDALKLFDLSGREIGVTIFSSDAYKVKFNVNHGEMHSNKVLLKVYTNKKSEIFPLTIIK